MIISLDLNSHLCTAKEGRAGGIYPRPTNMNTMLTYTREKFQLGPLSMGSNYWKCTFSSVGGAHSIDDGQELVGVVEKEMCQYLNLCTRRQKKNTLDLLISALPL